MISKCPAKVSSFSVILEPSSGAGHNLSLLKVCLWYPVIMFFEDRLTT